MLKGVKTFNNNYYYKIYNNNINMAKKKSNSKKQSSQDNSKQSTSNIKSDSGKKNNVNDVKLLQENIDKAKEEAATLKIQQNELKNTLNKTYKQNSDLAQSHADIIYKTYAPIKTENIKKKLLNDVEGFSLMDVNGGSKPILKFASQYIDDQNIQLKITDAELKNNKAALDVIDATRLTGVSYKYATTVNQNQLIQNQIDTNKKAFTTDMRKTDYKLYKIQWFEFINMLLFYIYYIVGFYYVFKVVVSYRPVYLKIMFILPVLLYPFVIGNIEIYVIFIYEMMKAYLLGNVIDTTSSIIVNTSDIKN